MPNVKFILLYKLFERKIIQAELIELKTGVAGREAAMELTIKEGGEG